MTERHYHFYCLCILSTAPSYSTVPTCGVDLALRVRSTFSHIVLTMFSLCSLCLYTTYYFKCVHSRMLTYLHTLCIIGLLHLCCAKWWIFCIFSWHPGSSWVLRTVCLLHFVSRQTRMRINQLQLMTLGVCDKWGRNSHLANTIDISPIFIHWNYDPHNLWILNSFLRLLLEVY